MEKENIVGIIALGLVISILLFIGIYGSRKSEIAECKKWQEMSAQFEGFYLVQWQADQCEARNIIINAPVK